MCLLFGYVRAYKPELKIKDYEAYKGVYCTLCTSLGKRYGILSRMTLSYDFTFFAIVRLAALQVCPGFYKGKCCFNPLKKCTKCAGNDEEFNYTCAVAMIMFYYKLKDDISDNVFHKRLLSYLLYPFAAYVHKKAAKNYPEAEQIVRRAIEKQNDAESKKTSSIDEAAHPTSEAMAALISYGFDGDTKTILERIGYCVGRWVYITDAFDDFEKDCKSGNYNTFAVRSGYRCNDKAQNDVVYKSAVDLLNKTADEAYLAYELLDCDAFKPVIENILDCGMSNCTKNILEHKVVKE